MSELGLVQRDDHDEDSDTVHTSIEVPQARTMIHIPETSDRAPGVQVPQILSTSLKTTT